MPSAGYLGPNRRGATLASSPPFRPQHLRIGEQVNHGLKLSGKETSAQRPRGIQPSHARQASPLFRSRLSQGISCMASVFIIRGVYARGESQADHHVLYRGELGIGRRSTCCYVIERSRIEGVSLRGLDNNGGVVATGQPQCWKMCCGRSAKILKDA